MWRLQARCIDHLWLNVSSHTEFEAFLKRTMALTGKKGFLLLCISTLLCISALQFKTNWTQVIFTIFSFQWSPTSQPILTSDPLYQQSVSLHWISSFWGSFSANARDDWNGKIPIDQQFAEHSPAARPAATTTLTAFKVSSIHFQSIFYPQWFRSSLELQYVVFTTPSRQNERSAAVRLAD